MHGGPEECTLLVDCDIAPRPDALRAAAANVHVPQVNEGAAVGALCRCGFCRGFVNAPAIETNHFATRYRYGMSVNAFRMLATLRENWTVRGTAPFQ